MSVRADSGQECEILSRLLKKRGVPVLPNQSSAAVFAVDACSCRGGRGDPPLPSQKGIKSRSVALFATRPYLLAGRISSPLHPAVAIAPAATVQCYHFPNVSDKAPQLL